MTIQNRSVAGKLILALMAIAGTAADTSAQNIDKFTVTGEMAKKAMIRGEINVATAEKLNQVCVEFAKQKKLEVANVILAPSGEIVLAYRMDGNAQSPFIMETAMLRAKTALARHQSTRVLYNSAEGNVTCHAKFAILPPRIPTRCPAACPSWSTIRSSASWAPAAWASRTKTVSTKRSTKSSAHSPSGRRSFLGPNSSGPELLKASSPLRPSPKRCDPSLGVHSCKSSARLSSHPPLFS